MNTKIPDQLLNSLQHKHSLKYFVETGANMGKTSGYMSSRFERVWTVEIVGPTQILAKKFLRKFRNVICESGSSPEFLLRVVRRLHKPTLFWLDAHWCGGPRLGPECPLLAELAAIGGLDGGHVIMIDDARLFLNPPPPPHIPDQWPSLTEIEHAVSLWKATVKVVDDIIVIEGTQ